MNENKIIQPTKPGAIDKTSGTPSGFPDFAFEHDGTEGNADPTLTLKDPWNFEVEGDLEVIGDLTLEGIFNGDLPSGIPIGSSMAWGESAAPVGYLKNDGSAVSRATYSDLFAKIGTTYGEGDGSTTFNVPKSGFDSGWLSTSTWTPGALIGINHGLYTDFTEYKSQVFIRNPAVPDTYYDVTDHEIYLSGNYGQKLQGIDGDLDNCSLKIFSSNSNYVNSAGTFSLIPTTWEYKVVIVRKDLPKDSIIRATNTSVTLEEVSSDIIADLTVTNSATIEDLEVNGSHPDLLGTDYTVLADYPTRKYNGTITLSEALTNFEYLVVKGQYYLTPYMQKFNYFPVALMSFGQRYELWSDDTRYARWDYIDSLNFTYGSEAGSWIRTIYGMGRKA